MSNDFDLNFDDVEMDAEHLEEVIEVSAEKEPEVVQNPVEVAKSNNTLSLQQELKFDFGSLNQPGVVLGEIGLEVSRFPVERARFTTSSRSLISIVSRQVVAVKSHYSEELGSYLCFGGNCCVNDGLPRVKYLFPIVVYDTDKSGKPVSTTLDFKVLSIGKDQYEDIMTIDELQGPITDFDLLITCKDEQYQKISIQAAGQARWKKSKAGVKATMDFWNKHMKDIVQSTARVMTEKEYNKHMGYDNGPQDADVEFDDVFD